MNTFIGLDKKNAVPIYAQIEDHLKKAISSGELKPNDKVPSEMEVAKKNNVSPMTVRHAYNRLVNAGILYRHQGKGTFVNKPETGTDKPRLLRSKKSIDIGILINSFQSMFSFSSQLIIGIEEACVDNAIKIFMMPTYADDLRSPQNGGIWDLMKSGTLDGLIVMGTVSGPETRKLLDLHLPLMVIDNDYIDKEVPAILTDDRSFAELAINRLIKKGIREIALLTSPLARKESNLERRSDKLLKTYKQELQKAGIPIKKDHIKICERDNASSRQAAKELLIMKKRPEAVIIDGDFMTSALMQTASEMDISLPGDVIPVNYGDSPQSPFAHISKPLAEMGKKAVIELKRIINNNEIKEKQIILPVKVHWQKPLI